MHMQRHIEASKRTSVQLATSLVADAVISRCNTPDRIDCSAKQPSDCKKVQVPEAAGCSEGCAVYVAVTSRPEHTHTEGSLSSTCRCHLLTC